MPCLRFAAAHRMDGDPRRSSARPPPARLQSQPPPTSSRTRPPGPPPGDYAGTSPSADDPDPFDSYRFPGPDPHGPPAHRRDPPHTTAQHPHHVFRRGFHVRHHPSRPRTPRARAQRLRGPRPRPRQDLRLRRHRGPRARRRHRRLRPGRVHRDHGPVRVRQVHADALPGRAGHRHRRLGADRRGGADQAERQSPDAAAPPPDRLHLPVLQPAAHADRRAEHPAAAGPGRAEAAEAVVGPGDRGPGPRRAAQAPPRRALRRPAAARGVRAGPDEPAGGGVRRRADRATWTPGPAPRCWRSCG